MPPGGDLTISCQCQMALKNPLLLYRLSVLVYIKNITKRRKILWLGFFLQKKIKFSKK